MFQRVKEPVRWKVIRKMGVSSSAVLTGRKGDALSPMLLWGFGDVLRCAATVSSSVSSDGCSIRSTFMSRRQFVEVFGTFKITKCRVELEVDHLSCVSVCTVWC